MFVLSLFSAAPAVAQMTLLSEVRSVTASYYGTGAETISSLGAFELFDAAATGTPVGGGAVWVHQKSTISTAAVSLEHQAGDFFGPGGEGRSHFELRFSLLQPTRITLTGACSYFSGFVSLTSDSMGALPLTWGADPADTYANFLCFEQVLNPGIYTLSSFEIPREMVTTQIELRAVTVTVPDQGRSVLLLAIGLLALFVAAAIQEPLRI